MSLSHFIPAARKHFDRFLPSPTPSSSPASTSSAQKQQRTVEPFLTLADLQFKMKGLAAERQERINQNRKKLDEALQKVQDAAKRAGIEDRFAEWRTNFKAAITTHLDPDWNLYFLTNLDLLLSAINNVWFPEYRSSTFSHLLPPPTYNPAPAQKVVEELCLTIATKGRKERLEVMLKHFVNRAEANDEGALVEKWTKSLRKTLERDYGKALYSTYTNDDKIMAVLNYIWGQFPRLTDSHDVLSTLAAGNVIASMYL